MSVGAKNIDHIVISSNDSAATAQHFSDVFGFEIKRTMSRPGSRAHMEFMKIREVILEFAGPGDVQPYDEVKARMGGFVVCVDDIEKAIETVRAAGFPCGDPHPAVQPGAKIASVKAGTGGVPFAFIQYNAIPIEESGA
jgi:catechol 2,3-dioxygenase-like lactoylglutathione lyase family enzyme